MTHICVSKLTIIVQDNGLSPDRCKAIIWKNTAILLILTLGTNFSEMLIEIRIFASSKIHLKLSTGKWCPFCWRGELLRVGIRQVYSIFSLHQFIYNYSVFNSNPYGNDLFIWCQFQIICCAFKLWQNTVKRKENQWIRIINPENSIMI